MTDWFARTVLHVSSVETSLHCDAPPRLPEKRTQGRPNINCRNKNGLLSRDKPNS